MRIPSIFRLPRHQRFNIEPRFYDPVKEDLDKRTSRIRQELKLEREGKGNPNSIRSAFAQRRKEHKSANMTQLLMVLIIAIALGGFVFYGASVYLFLLFLIPVYIFLKRKRA